jgi:hypothetical protein
MELSLRPQSVTVAEGRAAQKPFIVATGVGIIAALAGMYAYYGKAASVANEELEKVEAKVKVLEPKESAINAARNEISKKVADSSAFLEAVSDREYWVRVINDVNSRLPENFIWITEFSPPSASEVDKSKAKAPADTKPSAKKKEIETGPTVKVFISGLVLENSRGSGEVFDDFLKNLAESPFVTPPKDSEEIVRPTGKNDRWADKFSFPLRLKTPISLK